MNDLWVFGYASLMWRPGFDYVEKQRARLSGYHRSLCIYSWEHRRHKTTYQGLVMGLDRGGACVGVAFRIANQNQDTVMAYLRERELVTNVYLERTGKIELQNGEKISAVIYVADRNHKQYAGKLAPSDAANHVCGAVGKMGPNEDYVLNTAEHVKDLGHQR
ncbi:Glutathione-specific gamma-glutamylcyclotransferase [Nymphon striatum]|nr:Glutathione-specific gamma-glutamylcyclotransferase [Nymphon striatum]